MGVTINPFQPKGNFGLRDGAGRFDTHLRLMDACLKKTADAEMSLASRQRHPVARRLMTGIGG